MSSRMSSSKSQSKAARASRSDPSDTQGVEGPDQNANASRRSVEAEGVVVPPAVEGGEAKRVETRPPLRADVSPGDDGARVTVRIYHGKGRGAGPRPSPAASLFDSAVGSRSLVVRLYPNTFAVRLDWQDGELVGVLIDGAFPRQSGPTSTLAALGGRAISPYARLFSTSFDLWC